MHYNEDEESLVLHKEEAPVLRTQTNLALNNRLLLFSLCIMSYSGLVMTSNTILKVTMAPITLTFFQFAGTALLTTIISKSWHCRKERPSNEKSSNCCVVWRGGIVLCAMCGLQNNAYFLSSAAYVELCLISLLPIVLIIDTLLQRAVLTHRQIHQRLAATSLTSVAALITLIDTPRSTEYGPLFALPAAGLAGVYLSYVSRQRGDTLQPSSLAVDELACMLRGGAIVLFTVMIISERLRMPDEPYFPSQLIYLSVINLLFFATSIISLQYIIYAFELPIVALVCTAQHAMAAVCAAGWVDNSLSMLESGYIVVVVGISNVLAWWMS